MNSHRPLGRSLMIVTIITLLSSFSVVRAVDIRNENSNVLPYHALTRPRNAADATSPRIRITSSKHKTNLNTGSAAQISTPQQRQSVHHLLQRLSRYAKVTPPPLEEQGLQVDVEVRSQNSSSSTFYATDMFWTVVLVDDIINSKVSRVSCCCCCCCWWWWGWWWWWWWWWL